MLGVAYRQPRAYHATHAQLLIEAAADPLQLPSSNARMEDFQTWSSEEVSDWMVEKGIPDDVAKLFEGTKFRHFAMLNILPCIATS